MPPPLLRGGRGAVGFQPVITNLPEGAQFFSTAVISADRRYVRISPFPFFSQIGQVDTFNFGQQQARFFAEHGDKFIALGTTITLAGLFKKSLGADLLDLPLIRI